MIQQTVKNKRCSKGKSCGTTCIDHGKLCVLDLGPLIGKSTTKVVNMLHQRGSGGGSSSKSKPKNQVRKPLKTGT